jgi:hypothetical protein
MSNKSIPISFRLPVETKSALEKAAKEDSRSVSSLLDKLVSDWLRDHGYMTKIDK